MGCPLCPICYMPVHSFQSVHADKRPPDVGDVIVCRGCAGLLQLRSDRQLHALTGTWIASVPGEFRDLMYEAREALVDEWIKSGTPPTMYAWVMVEMRRKKERERKQ